MQKLLLHTCCAPCSIAIVDEMKSKYDLTVFFYNPNIHPEEEYIKRKKEVVRVCEDWGVSMIDMDYDTDSWYKAVKGLESEPEMGARCTKCFALRLEKSAQYAKDNEFEIYSTSLTSGRNKKQDIIGPLGIHFAKKYGIEYLDEDWKKKGRQEKGIEICKIKDVYRQDYCGCIYSRTHRASVFSDKL